jgi:hypothetical protein
MRINAATMVLLKAKAAIIQLRLPVWILLKDSKVESSNMACLPNNNSAAPGGSLQARAG